MMVLLLSAAILPLGAVTPGDPAPVLLPAAAPDSAPLTIAGRPLPG